MRFNNRFCALMDIPDLPAGAFEHIGDGKIKPQGGGNPISAITDPISKAIGTDGSGGGALGALAKIDPGPSLGSGLAEVDKFVGREIPGGWATVGLAAATAGAAAYAAPAAGAAAGTAGAGGTAGGIGVGGAFVPTAGSAASFTVPTAAAAGTAAGAAGIASEAGQAVFFESLAAGATGSEAIAAGLAAEKAVVATALAGPTYAELGYTGLAEGLAGPTYGELGLTGLQVGTEASAGAPIFDFSQEVMLSPGGNYIPANTLPSEIAKIDAQIKAAGAEALKKYGGASATTRALQGAMLARGLLGGQQPIPQQQQQVQQSRTNPYGGVDYSGLYNLLAPKMATRNPNSLLG